MKGRGGQGITHWLLTDGRQADGLGMLLTGLCAQLVAAGVPVNRATIGAPQLHPIAQSTFCLWDDVNGGSERALYWQPGAMKKVANSPMHAIYNQGAGTDWRLDDLAAAERFSIGPELFEQGYRHYLARALPFADGTFKALTVQTRQETGFGPADIALLDALVPAIAAAAEHHVQRRLAATLMDTFVGQRAGAQVLDGKVHRGDGEMIRAVIWLSDLRNFTGLSAKRPPAELLALINRYFEAVSDAITGEGGEVLKFIGDAVLGIFPVGANGPAAAAACAERAHDALMVKAGAADWPGDLRFGVGLHPGEVFYGNIGSRSRLDFTVIGPSVNLVSRVEGLCAELGRPLLVTEAFRQLSARCWTHVDTRQVKGVPEPVALFAPTE